MRRAVAAGILFAALMFALTIATAAVVSADPGQPRLVAGAHWVSTSAGPSLHIRPTPLGRTYDRPDGADIAWAQVLELAPDADTPGMRMQFDCHWHYARSFAPDKPSWDIEPWRPVVDQTTMLFAGCNPGGPDA